jgi:glucose/arabinose dehydrogenase
MHADVAIRFDRADNLLAGFGDGTKDKVLATALKAQDLDDLRGKIVRINPQTGEGVPGNPWYDASHPRSVRSKVYAFGLRNPFRFTVDPNNGTLYVGDVGWTAWDELDAFPTTFSLPARDRNGGWPCYEGADGVSAPQERYQTSTVARAACRKVYPPALHGNGHGAHAPLYAYRHGNTACIIAGPKYVGTSNYPAKYKGKVFVGDFTRDRFHTVDPATGVATDFGGPRAWGQPLDIQIAPDGNVAYLALGTNSLREITYGS